MRKIIDKNGRLFGLISFIDVLVILVILVLTIGIYCRFFVLDKTAVNVDSETIQYSVVIDESRQFVGENIQVGDKLFEGKNGIEIGTVTSIRITPAEVASTDMNGNYLLVPSEERYRVEMTIEGDMTKNGGRYYANRTYEINKGYQTEMYTKYVSFVGTILDIEG